MERVGNQLLVRPAAVGTVWTALTGGTQLTDLTTLTGTPITSVTADADGAVAFMGPDGVTSLYVDFGYAKRYAMAAIDTGGVLADFMGQGGEPGGWAQLDGTGLVPAAQLPKQLDWLIVTDPTFGAEGDGTTDDTLPIQAAIDACPPGGIVYFPRGVYKTTATLDLKNGVTLLGTHANLMIGPGMTGAEYPCFIQPATPFTGTSVVQVIGEDDGDHPDISGEQRIINLMFDGSQLTGTTIDGFFAKGNVQNVVFDNVCIRQMPNNGMTTADRTDGVFPYSWRLHHVMIDNCHANGILFQGNTDLTLDDVQVIGCYAQGIVLTNCTNTQLQSCRTEWNGSHGYHFTGAWGDWQGSGGMQMTGCSTDRNGQHGVLIDATGNTPILITGLNVRRDGRNGGAGGGGYAGLAVIDATVPVVIDGIICYPGVDDGGASTNSPQYGARFEGSAYVSVSTGFLHANTAGWSDGGGNVILRRGVNIGERTGATDTPVDAFAQPWGAAGNATFTGYTVVDAGQTNGGWTSWSNAANAFQMGSAGGGIAIKEGTNARMGVATLVAGTVTVTNTSVTANTRVASFRQAGGGTLGHLSATKINGTSFTITSSSNADTSTVAWILFEAA
ncbi:glycosyl hydrolase family 28-related protein [Streptomyces sp. ActVer]|uniref:right-handed parallel beta-helix repeat-containing protein n=1 Tax=Streptomyces sp. ActVer TaxID=3014558 RepID=UPI0022B49376|nr:glycosyl hydrolase family 28-related protein [Streptomyces sp. ActVer]MCZ4506933.1 glycosyl hydrolase family 28-related protein [Streptomyces sp. ActVer]